MTIVVRRATDDDLPAMVALLAELHDPSTARADADTWKRMLAQEGRMILLAEVDGEPAGTADISIAANLTHDSQSRAYVENVAVAAGNRRQGVGRALMTEVERVAHDAGCHTATRMSAYNVAGSNVFYTELGYERCSVGFRKSLEGS